MQARRRQQQQPTLSRWLGQRRIGRQFWLVALPLLIGLLAVVALAGYQLNQATQASAVEELNHDAEDIALAVDRPLSAVAEDVNFFAQLLRNQERLQAYQAALQEADAPTTNQERQFLAPLAEPLATFLENQPRYTYIAVLNARGQELVRVERSPDTRRVEALAFDDLQDDAGADYVQETLQLRQNQIWVSPVELRRQPNGLFYNPFRPAVRFSTSVFDEVGRRVAILVFQVDVTEALNVVAQHESQNGYAFLVDSNGYYLAHESPDAQDLLFGRSLDTGAQFVGVLSGTDVLSQTVEAFEFDDQDQSFLGTTQVIEPFSEVPGIVNPPRWTLVVAQEQSLIAGDTLSNVGLLLGIGLATMLLAGLALRIQANGLTHHLEALRTAMNRIIIGDLTVRLPALGESEIGQLNDSFNRSIDYVQDLIGDLETSVQARIRDLDITAQISREVAGLRELDPVLNHTINLIVDRFDFYHAQVFLIDDLRENAVLVASTGEPGRRLLAKNHRLPVGSESVIGRVTALGVTVIAGDTQTTDVPWRPNVELPETRAEMALPLKVEDRVIGALDIQSKRPDAFTPSDIEVFQVLADQLAIAINNARLLEESEQRLQEVAQLNERLTEGAWREFAARRPSETKVAFRYNLMDIQREAPRHATTSGRTVPISIRGINVGEIETDKTDLSEEEQALLQAVADRLSLAIDNARLFEETQLTLNESRRLYETARTISASADLDIRAIYTLIVEQLLYQETLDAVAILIADPIPSPRAATLIEDYQWVKDEASLTIPWTEGRSTGLLQIGLGEYFQEQPRNALYTGLLDSLPDDNPGKQALGDIQRQLGAETVTLLPLTSGVKWFGLLLVASETPNAFDSAFTNFVAAVADQLAIAIENRRLLEQVQDEARRSLALAEAGQLVSQIGGDFREGVTRLFMSISGPGEFNRWWFGLIEGGHLHQVTAHTPDPDQESAEVYHLRDDNNALTAAISVRQVILINDPYEEHPLLGRLSDNEIQLFGKHLAVPIQVGDDVLGAALIGRDPDRADLDERDVQLASTLASQLAVTTQNRDLFENIQRQQETLQTTLEAMPAGVVLLDRDGQVLLTNQRAIEMIGPGIRDGFFASQTYTLYYVDSDNVYSQEDFPLRLMLDGQQEQVSENISVAQPDGGRIDVLISAQPILDDEGQVTSAVAVIQEITELRELERALQSSLAETTVLYEASQTLLGASSTEELGPALLDQIPHLGADELYLIAEPADEFGTLPPVVLASEPSLPLAEPVVSDIPLPGDLLMPDKQIIIEDTQNITSTVINPELGLVAAQAGLRSMAVTPLEARGQRLGWLAIGYRAPKTFSLEDRRFINSLADQTAVSLDGIRLFENTERALQSVASLYQSSRRVAEAQGVREVIDIAREELLNFGPDRVDLLLQRSPEEMDVMSYALQWSNESSLELVPSLPVHHETAEPLAGFSPFSREEYYIENFLNEGSTNDLHEALYQLDTPYQALVSVPLRVGGRTIGRIGMGFLRPRYFSSDDRQLISTLADAMAYVVENDMLLEQTQESLEETGVLYQASRSIASAETREEIIEALLNYAASAYVDKTILVSLMSDSWDEPGAVIEITATWGGEEVSNLRGLYFTEDQYPIWEQLATPTITAYDDIANDPRISDHAKMGYEAMGMAAAAIVPLATPTGVLGCVVFGSSQPREHEAREVRIYEALADQAAVQLENKRLFEQAEFRTRQLVTAAEVSRAVTSILDLNELFPRVVNLIYDAFDYDHVQIFMLDDNREGAVLRASTGEAGRQLLAIEHSLPVGSDSVIGRVTSQGEPTIALDTTDPEVVHRPNPYLPETRSEMALPIMVHGTVVGALDVQSRRPQAFDMDDIQALTPLVDQLAVAIENARLFEFSEQRAEEMRFLFDVTSAAAAETELEGSLQQVIKLLLERMEASAASIFLYDPLSQTLTAQVEALVEQTTGQTLARPNEEPVILEMGQGLVGYVAETRQPQVVENLREDPRYYEAIGNSRSGIYTPLLAGPELIGVLALESPRLAFFGERDLEVLQALSTSVSAVIRTNQLLEEVQRTNERLREVDQLKTNFLAAMSHELRTPLNSIIGFSRVMLKGIGGPLTDMQEQDLQTIHDSGRHLLGLVNDILDQAKIEAGKMELVFEHFDLGAVIEGVMSSAVGLIGEKNIKLYTEVAENLPPAYGDEFRTRQILFNLVSNAAKFTKEGHITLRARPFTTDDGKQFIEIAVDDTGIGIDEKDYASLFESFQQVDNTTTRAAEGTGLGLPLSQSLAQLQGGDLWLESEVGVGSTFYVSVPAEPVVSIEDIEAEVEVTTPVDGGDGHSPAMDGAETNGHDSPETEVSTEDSSPDGRTILAVDDEEEVISLYRRYLRREGWYVVGTTDPAAVEEMIIRYHPQIILLDINMPERTGWQVLESLKANNALRDIPVIICSIDENTGRSETLGAARHLMKPFIESDLVKAVRAVEKREA